MTATSMTATPAAMATMPSASVAAAGSESVTRHENAAQH
jgi:hypothetical protein